MPNAISMLREDHRRLKKLLTQLDKTEGVKTREKLVGQIEQEIKIHAQIEEEIFYPAYKAAARKKQDKEHFYEATEEHHVVDMVLPALKAANPKSEEFGAKAKVLKDLVEHHIEEEEGQMFKKARQLMETAQLNQLGKQMEERQQALIDQWSNPITRPLKKMQSALHKLAPTKVKNLKAGAK